MEKIAYPNIRSNEPNSAISADMAKHDKVITFWLQVTPKMQNAVCLVFSKSSLVCKPGQRNTQYLVITTKDLLYL